MENGGRQSPLLLLWAPSFRRVGWQRPRRRRPSARRSNREGAQAPKPARVRCYDQTARAPDRNVRGRSIGIARNHNRATDRCGVVNTEQQGRPQEEQENGNRNQDTPLHHRISHALPALPVCNVITPAAAHPASIPPSAQVP